jgi:hypothetical protein
MSGASPAHWPQELVVPATQIVGSMEEALADALAALSELLYSTVGSWSAPPDPIALATICQLSPFQCAMSG